MDATKELFHVTNFLTPPTTELSHFLVDDTQLTICNGVNPSYKKGVLIKDLGYSLIGSAIQTTEAITGLFNFRQSPSVQKMLATVNDSGWTDLELYYSTGGAWTEIPAAQTAWAGFEDSLVEMESFIGYCFFVGYDATDGVWLPVGSLTGTTFSTSVNVTGMTPGKFICRYRDRLYVSNTSGQPFRTFFSSVPVAGAITWTAASDFFDVDFSEQITGISSNWDRLMIFTEFSAYMYDQDTKGKVWDTGCANSRSIQNYEGYMFWATKDNVWASTSGRPQAIGNSILDLIRNSTASTWRSAMVNREYVLYLGNTSANGISYTNCMATFNIETGMWRWRETYDSLTELASYTTNSDTSLWMGTSTGSVMVKSKYTDASQVFSDNTQPIVTHFRTKAYDMGNPAVRKMVTKIIAYAEVANDLQLQWRTFDKNQETLQAFGPIGTLDKVVNTFNKSAQGYFIQFEGREYSKAAPYKFYGLSLVYGFTTGL